MFLGLPNAGSLKRFGCKAEGGGGPASPIGGGDGGGVKAELEGKSPYVRQVMRDREVYGEMIHDMGMQLEAFEAADGDQVEAFLGEVERRLGLLSDEIQVCTRPPTLASFVRGAKPDFSAVLPPTIMGTLVPMVATRPRPPKRQTSTLKSTKLNNPSSVRAWNPEATRPQHTTLHPRTSNIWPQTPAHNPETLNPKL